MSAPQPVFSQYVRLSDRLQVGIHKFIIDQNDPPDSDVFTWNVKRLKRELNIVGSLLASNNAQAFDVVEVSVGADRTTASVTLTQAELVAMSARGDRNPHELVFVTFHDASDVNSNIRT